MRTPRMSLSLAALALVGACGRGPDSRADEALNTDLALAAQSQPYQAQQFTAPSEQQMAASGLAPQYNAAQRSAQPVYRDRAPVYRASRRRASRSTSRSSRGSSGGYYPSVPGAPRDPVRHTGRDAAIGAAAGAVIGATTSRDRVKGGLIGAAAGGILGGIIGQTVDVQHP